MSRPTRWPSGSRDIPTAPRSQGMAEGARPSPTLAVGSANSSRCKPDSGLRPSTCQRSSTPTSGSVSIKVGSSLSFGIIPGRSGRAFDGSIRFGSFPSLGSTSISLNYSGSSELRSSEGCRANPQRRVPPGSFPAARCPGGYVFETARAYAHLSPWSWPVGPDASRPRSRTRRPGGLHGAGGGRLFEP